MKKTVEEAKVMIEKFAEIQEDNGSEFPCPRCGHYSIKSRLATNALSRYADVYICDDCGTDEALRDATGKVMPLNEWSFVSSFNKL